MLRNENPPGLIAEIFSWLNKGAVELSDQETRHALFASRFDDLLGELSELPSIKNFKMGKAGLAAKDSREGEELVLRYFAFKETGGEYSDNLTKFLDRFMEKSISFDEIRIDDLRKDFQVSLTACQMLGEDEIFSDISRNRKRGETSKPSIVGVIASFQAAIHSQPASVASASIARCPRSACP